MSKLYVGDQKTRFEVETGVDLSGFAEFQLHVKKPDGTTHVWTGAQYDTTKILYTSTEGDLDQEGKYLLHSYVNDGGTPADVHTGDLVEFRVYAKWTPTTRSV